MGWMGLPAVGTGTKKEVDPTSKKTYFFVIEKHVEDVTQDQQKRSGSCGIDNKAHSSCKRRVTDNFAEDESI